LISRNKVFIVSFDIGLRQVAEEALAAQLALATQAYWRLHKTLPKRKGNEMDRGRAAQNLKVVENHFHSEALNEVEAALETFTDDIVWEAPAPNGLNRSFSGKVAVAKNYRELFASMCNVKFQFLQRFATEDRVVDDSIVTFEVVQDGYWHFPVGSKVEMRLTHIFEMRDGKISREIVFDMGRAV
jgi:ketosteroid isomerase-like protein